MYGHLIVGEKYRLETVGWRVPFFSMYKNIVYTRRIYTSIENKETVTYPWENKSNIINNE